MRKSNSPPPSPRPLLSPDQPPPLHQKSHTTASVDYSSAGARTMKIQCSVCEAAEAKVFCCADEAAMCDDCDQKVHAANRRSGKHQRVPLFASSSQMPKCDVCQETSGYFFCLEDRALLCRRCDIATHTANRLVSAHQRFLLTGVKVGLDAAKLDPPVSSGTTRSQSIEKTSGSNPPPAPRSTSMQVATTDQSNKTLPVQTTVGGDMSSPGSSMTKSFSQWELDEFLELGDSSLEFMDSELSKVQSAHTNMRFGLKDDDIRLDSTLFHLVIAIIFTEHG